VRGDVPRDGPILILEIGPFTTSEMIRVSVSIIHKSQELPFLIASFNPSERAANDDNEGSPRRQ